MKHVKLLSNIEQLKRKYYELADGFEEIDKLSVTYKSDAENFMKLSSWLTIVTSIGGDIYYYLNNQGFKTISLWCEDDTFIPVYQHLRAKKITIEHFLSNNSDLRVCSGTYGFMLTVKFKLYTTVNNLSNTDAIIIVGTNSNFVKSRIEAVTGGKAVFINDILHGIFYEKVLLETMKKVPVPVLFIENPLSRNVKNPSKHEKTVADYEVRLKAALKSLNFEIEFNDPVFLPKGYSKEYLLDITAPYYFKRKSGINYLVERQSKYSNVVEGHRVTVDVPTEYIGTIYMLGPSTMFGPMTDDENTLPSLLQKLLNESAYQFAVVNCSNYAGADIDRQAEYISKIKFKANDIVVSMFSIHTGKGEIEKYFPILDVQPFFDRPHNYGEVFTGIHHLAPAGYQLMAPHLFERLINDFIDSASVKNTAKAKIIKQNNMENIKHQKDDNILDDELEEQLSQYIISIKNLLPRRHQTGAIVVNANPFTLGHRYLIETAAKQVSHLWVFVVEENKSFFPFEDRLELVKKGISDLDNVTICPSGKFIISTLTFEAYSSKEELLQEDIEPPSLDVKIFASKIAPQLGISVRFVGEEPICNVTNQYNQHMKQLFPAYGITLIVIPRKCQSDKPISASWVRALLKEKNFAEIEKIVPQSTYDYLENFNVVLKE